MEKAATQEHAHPNTVYHCLFAYYHLGYSKTTLAHVFSKCERTISNWIAYYEEHGTFERSTTQPRTTFTEAHRQWLFVFYQHHPLSFLDEAQAAFTQEFCVSISISSVWRIIHKLGLTRKVLERRAMHVKERDIFRFVEELSHIDWSHRNLVFLDEVSFDNRGMIRKRGYAVKGETVIIHGDFERKPRVSILAFIGVDGVIDIFNTEGTFDRLAFTGCCQDFAHSKRSLVRQYPGCNSVWILDGASIHRHPEIVHYIRSIGVVVIFLPAYCPFFNPIEVMFGLIKKSFQRHYAESSSRHLLPFVLQTFRRFDSYSMTNVFAHCGWRQDGVFDPTRALGKEA